METIRWDIINAVRSVARYPDGRVTIIAKPVRLLPL